MKKYLSRSLLMLMLCTAGTAMANHVASPNPEEWWRDSTGVMQYVAPDEATIPNTGLGESIRYGKKILEETYKMLGPDSGLVDAGNNRISYVNSRLSCTNCHMESGRAAYGQPWAVVWYKYGAGGQGPWSARSNQYLDMKNRIHDCTQRSMNGTRLPNDSYELNSMIEYMKWLSTGMKLTPYTKVTHGTNNVGPPPVTGAPPVVPEMTRPANLVRGKAVYEEICALCHGVDGEGVWDPQAKKYIYPAVWGPYSFNVGAGMYRLRTAVGFIKGNMPYGWTNATDTSHQLSAEDAWDSMAYVISNDRPAWTTSLQDWQYYQPSNCAPNWTLKVTQLDAGYESYYPRVKPDPDRPGKFLLTGDLNYPAKYSPEQHKYGPWITPTQNMVAEMAAIKTGYENYYAARKAAGTQPIYPYCEPYEYPAP